MIAIPSRGNARIEWAVNMVSMVMPVGSTAGWKIASGMPVTEARNSLIAAMVENPPDFVFFLDDDVLMPSHAIRRMVTAMKQNPDWDLLTGVYVTKDHTTEPVLFGPEGTHGGLYSTWSFNTIFPISACGMGAALIRWSAFEKVGEPWFHWEHGVTVKGAAEEGEDVNFCRRLRESGGTLMCDGGVLCGHIDGEGKVYSLDANSYPMREANMTGVTVIDGIKSTGRKK